MLQFRTDQAMGKVLLEMTSQFEMTLYQFLETGPRFRLFRKDGVEFQTFYVFLPLA